MSQQPSRELLDPPSGRSVLDILIVGCKEQGAKQKGNSRPKPPAMVPRSEVLGKVKNFLGEIAKANEKLAVDAQEKPREEIDLEALTGNEKELIEMDLLLGVADLNSDEAVNAAESSMCGIQSTATPFSYSSSSEEEDDESDMSDNEQENSTVKSDDEKLKKAEDKEPKKKRQKIVMLN